MVWLTMKIEARWNAKQVIMRGQRWKILSVKMQAKDEKKHLKDKKHELKLSPQLPIYIARYQKNMFCSFTKQKQFQV